MINWQTIAVLLIMLCACVYLGRSVWRRLSSMSGAQKTEANSCRRGCGSCCDSS